MNRHLRERWLDLCGTLGGGGADEAVAAAVYADLVRRYGEPHRAYHTFAHVDFCLRELEHVRAASNDVAAVELAIWFHDAVYEIGTDDNEARSSDLAAAAMQRMGVNDDRNCRVRELIVVTDHRHPPQTPDQAMMLDVDLAILGQPPARFARYEDEIRREYAQFDDHQFAAGRARVLQQFIDRPRIYHLQTMADRYEQQARTNLADAIVCWTDIAAQG